MKRFSLVPFVFAFAAASLFGADARAIGASAPSLLEAKAKAKVEIDLPDGSGPGGSFGLGLIFGEPSGISAKLWFDDMSAADAGIAWSFYNQSLAFHADYLFHFRRVLLVQDRDIPLFAGVGGYMRLNGRDWSDPQDRDPAPDPVEFGARVPLGACYRFQTFPIELSLEVAPGIELFPATFFKLQGGIAVRYYF